MGGFAMKRERERELLRRIADREAPRPGPLGAKSVRQPASAYTCPERFARERDALFRGMPNLVGLSAECPRPGDHLGADLGGVPAVVLRQRDGSLRGFVNACRHRASRLLGEAGSTGAAIVCPYHGWTYGLDGALRARPRAEAGFDDLANRFVMRGVPHVLALRTSIASAAGPRTGWSGDGAPGDGSLRSFATGAVIQHFTKTLNRVPGVDFRLPTDEELDALEAFQLSLGRQQDLALPLPLRDPVIARGQAIFLDPAVGKCNLCHVDAGATADFGGGNLGNQNFDTGVEELPDQGPDLLGEANPPDDGLGIPGDGTFNTPPLVEAADTGPFFHDNAVATIEDAVAFYSGDAFDQSPSGRILAASDPQGVSIDLDATQGAAVAAFLRAINSLENIRESIGLLERAVRGGGSRKQDARLLARAAAETEDARAVLAGAGLHPDAVALLERARALVEKARGSCLWRERHAREAIRALEQARDLVIGSS
jgi:nitrite reductase/ring-hydroxylating ferredoxin subunit